MTGISTSPHGDYVLGTDDVEVRRLGLQHRLWRHRVLDCWRRAGIHTGQRVCDVGAGPGYATLDLAEAVGPDGHVTALERSERFLAALRSQAAQRVVRNVTALAIDLDQQGLGVEALDATWCRWVLSFVHRPAAVIANISAALKPGGRAIFHEYLDYRAWRLLPRVDSHDRFVEAVMASWRAAGGEPDIGGDLPQMLEGVGLRVVTAEPVNYVLNPTDPMWEWLAFFIESGRARLVELGYLTANECADIANDFAEVSVATGVRMLTPTVLEVIAVKA